MKSLLNALVICVMCAATACRSSERPNQAPSQAESHPVQTPPLGQSLVVPSDQLPQDVREAQEALGRDNVVSVPFAAAPGALGPLFNFDPNNTDAIIGRGFNTIQGRVRGDCVEYKHTSGELTVSAGDTATGGQRVTYLMQEITSRDQLRQTLNVDGSASFGFGIFGADAKVRYATSGDFTSYGNYVFVNVSVVK